MASATQLPIQHIVSFEPYAPSILSTAYHDVKVVAHLDYATAKALGTDVDAIHENIYPDLPSGTPTNPSDYDYVRLQFQNGQYTIVGLPWIKGETIKAFSRRTLVIEVSNATGEDRQVVTQALAANGYKAARVTFKE